MKRLGVVHIISPEQAVSSPGMRLVCGDSQTSTYGAFGMLAHGIGTSEVEHMLGTQTLLARKSENMLLRVEEELAVGCSAKDIVLATIDRMRPAGGTASWRRSAASATAARGYSADSSLYLPGRALHPRHIVLHFDSCRSDDDAAACRSPQSERSQSS